MSFEKTEKPTEQKKNNAIKKGQVAKSTDVISLIMMGGFILFFLENTHLFHQLVPFSKNLWLRPTDRLDNEFLYNALSMSLRLLVDLSLPFAFFLFFLATIGNIGQIGLLFTTHPIKFNLDKINPFSGLKKIINKEKFIDLFINLLKFSLISLVIVLSIKNNIKNICMLYGQELFNSWRIFYQILMDLIKMVSFVFLMMAFLDFFWQKYKLNKSLMMSKYEIKKEYKEQEGDPQIKGERRKIYEEMLEESQFKIENAKVLITNPTHVAIAISYDESASSTPKVIIKGFDEKAKRLIKLAKRHSLPIIRNVPLAHELKYLHINEEIPEKLFEPVAEILAFIFELEQKARS